jgi:hypothetical protein
MEGDGLGYSTLIIELMEKDMDGKASSFLKHLMGGLVVLRPDCRKTILSSLHTRLTGTAPLARPEALQEVHLKLMTLCIAGCAAFPPEPVCNSEVGCHAKDPAQACCMPGRAGSHAPSGVRQPRPSVPPGQLHQDLRRSVSRRQVRGDLIAGQTAGRPSGHTRHQDLARAWRR